MVRGWWGCGSKVVRGRELHLLKVCVIGLVCVLLLQLPVLPEESVAEQGIAVEQEIADVTPNTVMLGGQPLFQIQTGLGSISANDRAEIISERLAKVAHDSEIPLSSLRIESHNADLYIVVGTAPTIPLVTIRPEDAAAANFSSEALANQYLKTIQEAIATYRKERSAQNIMLGLFYTVIITLTLFLVFNLINRLFSRMEDRLKTWLNSHSSSIGIWGTRARTLTPFVDLILRFIELGHNLINLVLIGLYIFLIFSFFPWTKPLSENFWRMISLSLQRIEQAVIAYLPNLFILTFVIFITCEVLAFTRLYFREIERGNISVPWLYPDWVRPTFQLIRFFIIALALAIGLPFLPGFNSPAFQGVSLVLSALFTFGAAGAVSNIVGGVIAVYTRGFQLGDMIKIGELMGIVTEKNLLVTRIRTPKNVIITMPNSTILGSNIINYSALARGKGDKMGLILHTTVTLGYDIPWHNVHEALVKAACATPDILPDPPPFVLQTSLNDYHVSYELNAYTACSEQMPVIYSNLHQNIQDYCNAAGIEILSPGYHSVRDGNHSTIPENYLPRDYHAPGFRLDSTSPNHPSE